MKNISLKYRITLVIFMLECLMIYFLLGPIQSNAIQQTETQFEKSENAKLEMLGELSRISLFTSEYDEIQPYFESMTNDPNISDILIINADGYVVVSSNVLLVGQTDDIVKADASKSWKTLDLYSGTNTIGVLAIKFSRSDMLAVIDEINQDSRTTALVGLIVITIAAMLASFLLTRRLNMLTSAAKSISEGNYNNPLNFKGSDELTIVGTAFDKMSENIKRNIDELNANKRELEASKENLERRVKERTQELAHARDNALEANKAKSAFLANMSHELRTPLNIIIGYTELIQSDPDQQDNKNLMKDIDKIASSGQHLLGIINSILDLTSIEAGKMGLFLEEDNMIYIVEGVIEKLRSDLEKSGNSLNFTNKMDNDTVYGDSSKIRKIIGNILCNAIKFTHNNKIDLELSNVVYNNTPFILCKITDTGIGMSETQINSLFSEFTQADNSYSRKYEGTGLGLAICKHFSQLVGGHIEVESTENVGSTFNIYIPQRYQEPDD